MNEKIIESIKKIEKISNEILQTKEKMENEKLERYFCNLEKARMDMYEEIMQRNLWLEFDGGEGTEFIDYNYKAKVENEILKIHIPEKIPPIKKGASYTQKRITSNIARITRKYEGLFYDKFTMTIIKIYDNGKIWDADNRNVKPIQNGLIHGKVIKDEIRLQNRDIELLIFLGKYKIISLDNTRYIYETVTYQEKRIVNLVKHNYIRRLKHRYITLGIKGKEYLLENGFEVREHCRNENNMERLNVISDIASCLIQDNFNFIPSWNLKKEDEPTTHSRRYIGKLEYNEQDEFLVYAIYDGKDDKYVKSIYYDIRKENGYTNAMIFTNNMEKIVLHEKGFYFGNKYTVLVPYDEYGKFLIRNNYKIRNGIYLRIKEMYNVELSDFRLGDLKLDDNNYVVIMPLINMEKLVNLNYYFNENDNCKNIYIFGLAEYENIIKKYLPKCDYNSLSKEKIKELLEKYEETGGIEDEIV